ncbi:hypothetical protein CBR_g29794 [Chara braunii]|uniref:Annexin n=1 Tax=Chara braunii TaxID=69332 RepID=A0A388LBE5_CHABU|nr:hypothetical protein CBR_g29794 [Chara braunii]|eukprot:GBG79645.1 hypothetical protein CBR_g29794 [Chara braunii]
MRLDSYKIETVKCLSTDRQKECAEVLIEMATKRAWFQRDELTALYRKRYGERISDSIKAHLGQTLFTDALRWCFEIAPRRDAEWLYKAMEGLGSDAKIMCEIICSRNSRQLETIKIAYKELYGTDLVKDVESESYGSFQKFLIKLLTVPRMNEPADETRAMELAKDLYDAAGGRWFTDKDKDKFIEVFTTESKPQIAAVYSLYKSKFGSDLICTIEAKFKAKLKEALVFLCRWILWPAELFADEVNKAIGTDQKALIRLILARGEMDLENIKQAFEKKYKKPLAERIAEVQGGSDLFSLLLLSSLN